MKRGLSLALSICLLNATAFSVDFGNIIKQLPLYKEMQNVQVPQVNDIKKQLPIPKEIPKSQVQQQKQDAQSASISCEEMLAKSPKKPVIEETAKNVLIGVAVGAVVGALVSKDKAKGAILGAVSGAAAGIAYSYLTTQDTQRESLESAAKRLGYRYDKPELFLEFRAKNKSNFKRGDYLVGALRITLLTPQKDRDQQHQVTISAYLVKDGERIPLGVENYYFNAGTTPVLYAFPICDAVKPGAYKIAFEVIGLGTEREVVYEFRVF